MEMYGMELIPRHEVFQTDKRNTKKTLLPIDAICTECGIIFNSYYEESCILCDDKRMIGYTDKTEDACGHKEFIVGKQSVDLRILLDFHIEDLRALCEIHGCQGGSRGKMAINIMKRLYPSLDKRIDESLVRKMIKRNSRRFRFWRDIEDAITRAKKSKKIELISADDCIDVTEIGKK